jgi:serine O-acetyltransferase
MGLWQRVRRDIEVALERDPAARTVLEVVLFYPGFHARELHRLSHTLWEAGIPVLPRFVSHVSRWLTGVEIHPAARIGEGLFIDHGMGVVIGETTEIGDDVTLYQGVTLGGTSRQRTKRHPTLGDRVVIGAGSVLIGDINIGDDVKVGAGSVVITSVPSNATVVGVPGRVVSLKSSDGDTIERLPDPEWEIFQQLQKRLIELELRIHSLEAQLGQPSNGLPEPIIVDATIEP